MIPRKRSLLVTLVVVLSLILTACNGDSDDVATDDAPPDAEPTGAAEDAGPAVLTISADTVSGPRNIPEEQRGGAVCVLQSRFPRNSEIVWRARVMDSQGAELSDDALESVEVRLADGQTFDMRYGPHPREDPTDFFWTAAFEVPADHPSGTLGYEISATANDGATGAFKPFEVAASLLTITDDVLETIEEDEEG